MSIATKTGDDGTTALMYGRRLGKWDARVASYGAVDELNAALGVARAAAKSQFIAEPILAVQKELVILMGELAVADQDVVRYRNDGYASVSQEMVARLTALVDDLEQNHQVNYKGWATPGGTPVAAALDFARTVCRRAERHATGLSASGEMVNPHALSYLNRLSDLLWLYARWSESHGSEHLPGRENIPSCNPR